MKKLINFEEALENAAAPTEEDDEEFKRMKNVQIHQKIVRKKSKSMEKKINLLEKKIFVLENKKFRPLQSYF